MTHTKTPPIENTWLRHLETEFSHEYYQKLNAFLKQRKANGARIYPARSELFFALNSTPIHKTKVVILGQDPYHGEGQAHGMCFSVKPGIKVPPSLKNIFKELESDLNVKAPNHGHLKKWADQGVLLLNDVLTVEQGKAHAHKAKGWEKFTDKVIETLNLQREGLVFLLWGSPAQKKGQNIDKTKHHVLKAPHPSPLSAYRGFFGCKHFSKTNELLIEQGKIPIDWTLPNV